MIHGYRKRHPNSHHLDGRDLNLLKLPYTGGFLPWLIRQPWFHLPMLTLAIATAIHATDVYLTAIRSQAKRPGSPHSPYLDPVEIPGWMATSSAEHAAQDLERRIAAMAPEEPHIIRLYEAIKILEHAWGLDLDIKLDLANTLQSRTYIRRTTRGPNGGASFNLGIDMAGGYTNSVMYHADTYSYAYANFVAAYGFLERTPSPRYHGYKDVPSN